MHLVSYSDISINVLISLCEKQNKQRSTKVRGTECVFLLLNVHVLLEHQLYLLLDCFPAQPSDIHQKVTQ